MALPSCRLICFLLCPRDGHSPPPPGRQASSPAQIKDLLGLKFRAFLSLSHPFHSELLPPPSPPTHSADTTLPGLPSSFPFLPAPTQLRNKWLLASTDRPTLLWIVSQVQDALLHPLQDGPAAHTARSQSGAPSSWVWRSRSSLAERKRRNLQFASCYVPHTRVTAPARGTKPGSYKAVSWWNKEVIPSSRMSRFQWKGI